MDSILASHPAAPGWIPGIPEVFTEKFFREGKNCLDEKSVDVAQVNRQHWCLEQWTAEVYFVYQTYLVLASGKLVLQKSINVQSFRGKIVTLQINVISMMY